ncbi:MAG TPA: 2-oxoacid:acceptor oxidoreductase subunit alpha [Desulfurococcaceae archaeon]|nr:2-oxoacid:acceptor oxidoreductase subunit alpha [Desulfurococcaceae archaeon]
MGRKELSLMVGGPAGAGVMRTGQVFASMLMYMGYYVFGTNEYPSLIRGGHNMYKIYARLNELVYSQYDTVDIYLALDQLAIKRREKEVAENGIIIYDSDEVKSLEKTRNDIKFLPIPLKSIVKEKKAPLVTRNMAGVGAVARLLGIPFEYVEKAIRRNIPRYIDENLMIAKAGYEYAEKNYDLELEPLEIGKYKPRILIDGNTATAIAAVKAGVKVFAAYPITPQTPILEYMAHIADDYDIAVIQAEHEIASILIAIGAAYAGVRAMTATSGPGLALKTESVGLASMSETPLVIVNVQRQGPSTGMATQQAQGDLLYTVHIGHSEYPLAVVAPGDIEEIFEKTLEAFNIAEKYQIPVIILIDKHLAESHYTVDPENLNLAIPIERGEILSEKDIEEMKKRGEEYKRYKITDTGVSPRVFPGTKGVVVRAESSEHDENGFYTEDPVKVTAMWNKRWHKLETLARELDEKNITTIKYYGVPADEADFVIVTWGSTKGPVLEAMRILSKDGLKIGMLQVIYMKPFPSKKVVEVLEKARKVVVVENNYQAQLAMLIREYTGFFIEHRIVKYDGRQFNPYQLSRKLLEVVK